MTKVAVIGKGAASEAAVEALRSKGLEPTVIREGALDQRPDLTCCPRSEGRRRFTVVSDGERVECDAVIIASDHERKAMLEGRRVCFHLRVQDRGSTVHAIGEAIKLAKEGVEVYIIAEEVLAYGMHELSYLEAQRLGVSFILGRVDELREKDGMYSVRAVERGMVIELEVGSFLEVDQTPDDGPLKARDPGSMEVSGSFVDGVHMIPAGLPEDETAMYANAAVAGILSEHAATDTAFVDTERCSGCLTCVRTCIYRAPGIVDGKASIDPALCKGCGVCVSLCPSRAIDMRGSSDASIILCLEGSLGP